MTPNAGWHRHCLERDGGDRSDSKEQQAFGGRRERLVRASRGSPADDRESDKLQDRILPDSLRAAAENEADEKIERRNGAPDLARHRVSPARAAARRS